MRRWPSLLLLTLIAAAQADTVTICFNYGCQNQAQAEYDEGKMFAMRVLLGSAQDAGEERQRLALAVGWLLGWAGEQTPIAADRGGNYADQGVYGRMDCIDHATTTTQLLQMLEARGWLRFHRVLPPVGRLRYLFAAHYAAQIVEIAAPPGAPSIYVVDSWFRDNGQPAVVSELSAWQDGHDDEDDVRTVTTLPAGDRTFQ